MDRDDVRAREALGTISRLFREFKVGSLLNFSNINQTKGDSPLEIFSIIFKLCFTGKNLFEGVIRNKAIKLNKRHIYGFLNNPFYNWRKLLFLFSTRVYLAFKELTSNPDEEVLIVDNSIYDRNRSKVVELLVNVFDHNPNKFIKGFRTLTLGWSDGDSFLGLDFALLSSSKSENRYCEVDTRIDNRSRDGIHGKEAVQKATEPLPQMVKRVLTVTSIRTKRLLMDSWFSYPKLINELLNHIDVIRMVKDHAKVYYRYNGKLYRLSHLYNAPRKRGGRAVVKASVVVVTKQGDPVRLVFVKADNKRGWLALLSTDLLLEETEIIRLYGKRWDIEVFFKTRKQRLKLVKEIQLRNFDGLIAHTTMVMTRYKPLSYEQRVNVDLRSYSDAFREFFDELANLSFIDALTRVLAVAMERIRGSKQLSESIISGIIDIIMSSTIRFFNLGPRQASLC